MSKHRVMESKQIADLLTDVLRDLQTSYERLSDELNNEELREFVQEEADHIDSALERLD